MTLTISTSDIKNKLLITDSTFDTAISALITEMQSALELQIDPAYLADASIRPILTLAVAEVMAGEFLERLMRKPGATEAIAVAGITIGAPTMRGVDLTAAGMAALAPYLKGDIAAISIPENESVFTLDEEVW